MNVNKVTKIIKVFFVIALIIVLLIAFSSSYTSLSIDNLAFVIAIAIDVGDSDENVKVTFQLEKPSSISQNGSPEDDTTVMNTVETSSISTAINFMNAYIGKEINLSHCKLVVFSEEIASKNISDKIYTLVNDIQIRPSTNIIVSKTTAKYYLENSKPSLEALPTKYYEIFPNSSKYTGYTVNVTIGDFYRYLSSNSCEPYAILGGIIDSDFDSLGDFSSNNPLDSGDMKSNEASISGKRNAENIGLAVFKDGKLVGELNAMETVCFLIVKNDVKGFFITIRDPRNSEKYIDLHLYYNNDSKSKVEIINNTPYITVNCKFDARIYSMHDDAKYVDEQVLKEISEYAKAYMKLQISNYLYKTSKEYKSDINAFGLKALSCFRTVGDFEKYNWHKNYEDAFFTVNTEVNVKSSFLLTET